MKRSCAMALAGLGLLASLVPASAQYYGGGGGYDRGYRERDRGYDYEERGPRRDRGFRFSESEYLACHPDVRRAVRRGEMESGFVHYQRHGRREGRQLSC